MRDRDPLKGTVPAGTRTKAECKMTPTILSWFVQLEFPGPMHLGSHTCHSSSRKSSERLRRNLCAFGQNSHRTIFSQIAILGPVDTIVRRLIVVLKSAHLLVQSRKTTYFEYNRGMADDNQRLATSRSAPALHASPSTTEVPSESTEPEPYLVRHGSKTFRAPRRTSTQERLDEILKVSDTSQTPAINSERGMYRWLDLDAKNPS